MAVDLSKLTKASATEFEKKYPRAAWCLRNDPCELLILFDFPTEY